MGDGLGIRKDVRTSFMTAAESWAMVGFCRMRLAGIWRPSHLLRRAAIETRLTESSPYVTKLALTSRSADGGKEKGQQVPEGQHINLERLRPFPFPPQPEMKDSLARRGKALPGQSDFEVFGSGAPSEEGEGPRTLWDVAVLADHLLEPVRHLGLGDLARGVLGLLLASARALLLVLRLRERKVGAEGGRRLQELSVGLLSRITRPKGRRGGA